MHTLSPRRLLRRESEIPWVLAREAEDSYLLQLRSRWPAYEVTIERADDHPRALPLVRIASVPPRTSLRVPTALPATGDRPWVRVSWRESPRGGPRRSQRSVSALLSASEPTSPGEGRSR